MNKIQYDRIQLVILNRDPVIMYYDKSNNNYAYDVSTIPSNLNELDDLLQILIVNNYPLDILTDAYMNIFKTADKVDEHVGPIIDKTNEYKIRKILKKYRFDRS